MYAGVISLVCVRVLRGSEEVMGRGGKAHSYSSGVVVQSTDSLSKISSINSSLSLYKNERNNSNEPGLVHSVMTCEEITGMEN